MAKIKITEAQLQMLQNIEASKPRKVIKITEDQFNRLFSNINENEKLTGHPVAGDGGDEYNPQTEKENEATQKAFNESVSEDVNTMVSANDFLANFKQLILDLSQNPNNELSQFWTNLGITKDAIVDALEEMHILTKSETGEIKLAPKETVVSRLKKGGVKELYDKFVANRAKQESTISLGDDMEIAERTTPAPAPAAPQPTATAEGPFNLVYYNEDEDGLALFQHDDELFAHLNHYFNADELTEYCQNTENPEASCIASFVNDKFTKGEFKPKTYGDNFTHNMLTLVDANVKNMLLKHFHNPELENALNGVEEVELGETTTTGSVGGSYVTPKIWAKSPADMKFANKPMYKQGKILKNKLTELEKVSLRRFVVEMDMYLYGEDEKAALVDANEIAAAINKKYDAHARVTQYEEMPFGKSKIGESVERPGQVEFDDCTQLNNNTEAQDGGCSVGAIDNVVKVKESLSSDKHEALINEVAFKTGRSSEEVRAIIGNNNK